MDITPLISENKNLINGYREGKFLVNNQEYYGSIIIFPEKVIKLKESDVNSKEYFESFLTEEIEILLIGTGKTRNILCSSVKSYLMEQKGLNFEFMTTGSACRTHNVLISEDRFVVSYLIAI
ncbi:Mth938-like domain-containing protein [Wolbachia endosymbiont of Drosophila bocki]|uniref:Mth938-like domain-containing protein n=1 Tax=unclassified Wolbachia TaxID=2640676 RepID=UPI0023A98F7F|nr:MULTISPECIES: Mth938-like domain-containing protein [unclassified Wolbachia]MDE5057936.1 Mth938-like domain-containing protein [Wolbachia endosymbiont of Drosophila bocki]MDE5067278.1 Mth938-like domain-containing protein [Wolbachia endosymbiont of Drosophila leontia]